MHNPDLAGRPTEANKAKLQPEKKSSLKPGLGTGWVVTVGVGIIEVSSLIAIYIIYLLQ